MSNVLLFATFINELYRADSLSRLFHRSFSFDWSGGRMSRMDPSIHPIRKGWMGEPGNYSARQINDHHHQHHHSPSLLLSGIGIFGRSRIGSLPVGVEWTQVHLWMTVNEGNHLSSSLSPFRILQIPTKNGSLFGPPPVNNSPEVTLLCILKFWQSACVFAIVIRKSGVCRIFKIHCETYESWSIENGKAKSRVIVLYFPGHLNHHRHTSSFVVL